MEGKTMKSKKFGLCRPLALRRTARSKQSVGGIKGAEIDATMFDETGKVPDFALLNKKSVEYRGSFRYQNLLQRSHDSPGAMERAAELLEHHHETMRQRGITDERDLNLRYVNHAIIHMSEWFYMFRFNSIPQIRSALIKNDGSWRVFSLYNAAGEPIDPGVSVVYKGYCVSNERFDVTFDVGKRDLVTGHVTRIAIVTFAVDANLRPSYRDDRKSISVTIACGAL